MGGVGSGAQKRKRAKWESTKVMEKKAQILRLARKNLSHKDISAAVKLARSTVKRVIDGAFSAEDLKLYRERRLDTLDGLESLSAVAGLETLSTKAGRRRVFGKFGPALQSKYHEMGRLERSQATSIVAYADMRMKAAELFKFFYDRGMKDMAAIDAVMLGEGEGESGSHD